MSSDVTSRGTHRLALIREKAFKNSFLFYLDCGGPIPGRNSAWGKVSSGNGRELQAHSLKLNLEQISSQCPSASPWMEHKYQLSCKRPRSQIRSRTSTSPTGEGGTPAGAAGARSQGNLGLVAMWGQPALILELPCRVPVRSVARTIPQVGSWQWRTKLSVLNIHCSCYSDWFFFFFVFYMG